MKANPSSPPRRGRHLVRALACAVFGSLLLQATSLQAQDNKQPEKITDKQITNAVEARFLFDNAVPWSFVDVKTDAGIVTLSGTADNLLAKDRAARIVESIKGVRAVVNNIDVQTVKRTDEEIRQDVERALLMDAAADSYELKPKVNGGVVTLTGTVQSFKEQNLALQLAKGVRGVKEVKDEIELKYKAQRPDPEIVADAQRALENDVWLNAAGIKVTANDGKVTLSGTVGSAAEKTRARTLAWVMGVQDVAAEGLKVDPLLANQMRRSPTKTVLNDEAIKKAVEDAFVADPRVFSFNPEVEVNNGIVTLTGVVDNIKAKNAAEQDAKNTLGVFSVRNYLKVRPVNPPDDDKLAQNVKQALLRDPIVESYEIDVQAGNGTVTLEGNVDSFYEKSQAEDVANRINGVVLVNNNLDVRNPAITYYNMRWDPYFHYQPHYTGTTTYWKDRSDPEIKNDITDELFWSPFVDEDEVNVSVDNRVATLTGAVDTWNEYFAAAENAREGGAASVINRLKVE